jgi:hypothetical protein
MAERIASFEEFWRFYLREHSQPTCRAVHYLGTIAAWVALMLGLFVSAWWLLAIPFVGYGPAWFGHFVIEKNKPASFGYPLWSLTADYRMFALAMTGRLGPELSRARVGAAPESTP